jgi:hypothetical protein
VVADEAKARRLELAVASGLALLGDELGLEVPAFVRETLSGALRSRIFLAEFVSEATDRNSRTPSQRVISALAERLRSRGLRQTRPPEMPKVTMLPSSASRSDRDRTPLQLSASQPIYGEPSLSTLLFDFDVEEGGQRYDFDVFVDGRWVARIKLRGRRWLPGRSLFRLVKVLVPSRWQRRTFNTLKLVALDSAHNPQPIAGVRASLLHR